MSAILGIEVTYGYNFTPKTTHDRGGLVPLLLILAIGDWIFSPGTTKSLGCYVARAKAKSVYQYKTRSHNGGTMIVRTA